MFINVSLDFPQCVAVSALSILIVFFDLTVAACMCWLYVNLGSNVIPSIFGFLTVGKIVSSIVRVSVWLYSAGSGVKRVVVVFVGFSFNEFCVVQWCIWCRYGCICACAVSGCLCDDNIVMSSAYVTMSTWGGGFGMSDV